MRGSGLAKTTYETSPSVTEKPRAVLELNANAGVPYRFAGYYQGTGSGTYTEGSGTVTGADFTTKYITRQQPIISGDPMTNVADLQYVDEPDKYYEELFSIKSVLKPQRPDPGIVKMVGNSESLMIPGAYARLYPCSRTDSFKYWRAANDVDRNPFVVYERSFWASKLKITMQNYAGLPKTFAIQVLPDGSNTWTSVFTNSDGAWDPSGVMKVYYYDSDWTTTPNLAKIQNLSNTITQATKIRGVRVLIYSMGRWNTGRSALVTDEKVPVEVIEISPRLSVDVSDSIISFNTNQSLSEADSPLPIGSISSNDAELDLENYAGHYSFELAGSLLYGHQPKQSVVDLYFDTTLTSGAVETNRIMYGIIDDTEIGDDSVLSLKLKDSMKILQERKIRNFYMRNKRLSFIVQTILDYVGVTGIQANWAVSAAEEDVWIPYYYIKEATAYQALADLAEAYQFSLSYDADNILQMYSKEAITLYTDTVDSVLTYDTNGAVLPNIVSIDATPGTPVNDVSIAYSPHWIDANPVQTDLGKPMWDAQFEPALSEVWAGEESILACAPLVRPLTASTSEPYIVLDQEGGEALDYQGYIQIDAEVISYDAKQYHLKRSGSTYQYYWVTSQEQYNDHLDNLAAGSRIYFTGKLRIPTGGRGAFNSTIQKHEVSTAWDYPYSENFNSYKTCPLLPVTGSPVTAVKANNKGQKFWDYSGGGVQNLRGDVTFSGGITRSGAESAIRMYNAKESDFLNFAQTSSNAPRGSTLSAHWYLTNTPSSIIPYRVGAGVRILGRMDGDQPVSALGVNGTGGVGMFMRYTGGRMNGWVLEIRPTVEAPSDNVKLFSVSGSNWTERAKATVPIMIEAPDVNTSVDTNDSAWTNVDLAFYPDGGSKFGGRFVGIINNSTKIRYTVPSNEEVEFGSYYGPVVRGDSYMDVDYVWWSDRSDPNSVDGYNSADDLEVDKFNIRDALNGTGGPPAWWDSGSATLYKPGAKATIGIFEFGAYAHAVKVLDVDFSVSEPVINPKIATRRGAEYKVPVFDSHPFGAKMVVVNARKRAVSLAGDTAAFSIVGYKLETSQETYTLDEHRQSGRISDTADAKALASATVHGYVPLEVSTDMIQGKDYAIDLMEWILETNAIDCDSVDVEIFGNPLVEPGDRFKIYSDSNGYGASETFIAMQVRHSWGEGLKTEIGLRRVK